MWYDCRVGSEVSKNMDLIFIVFGIGIIFALLGIFSTTLNLPYKVQRKCVNLGFGIFFMFLALGIVAIILTILRMC